jgi:hypothetical protein
MQTVIEGQRVLKLQEDPPQDSVGQHYEPQQQRQQQLQQVGIIKGILQKKLRRRQPQRVDE